MISLALAPMAGNSDYKGEGRIGHRERRMRRLCGWKHNVSYKNTKMSL